MILHITITKHLLIFGNALTRDQMTSIMFNIKQKLKKIKTHRLLFVKKRNLGLNFVIIETNLLRLFLNVFYPAN